MTKLSKVKHSGVAFEDASGDGYLIVPPLTVGQVEMLTPTLVEHDAIKVENFNQINERVKLRARVIGVALHRNYPDITEDDINEFVTLENSEGAFRVALGMDRASKRVKDVGEISPVAAS